MDKNQNTTTNREGGGSIKDKTKNNASCARAKRDAPDSQPFRRLKDIKKHQGGNTINHTEKLTKEQGEHLIKEARKYLQSLLSGKDHKIDNTEEWLNKRYGIFVTLHTHPAHDLRGCICPIRPEIPESHNRRTGQPHNRNIHPHTPPNHFPPNHKRTPRKNHTKKRRPYPESRNKPGPLPPAGLGPAPKKNRILGKPLIQSRHIRQRHMAIQRHRNLQIPRPDIRRKRAKRQNHRNQKLNPDSLTQKQTYSDKQVIFKENYFGECVTVIADCLLCSS